MTPPTPIVDCFNHAEYLASKKYPYSFGGGHPGFGPSKGTNGLVGYDCSGWVSAILNQGAILHSKVAMDTGELLNWGEPGEGEYMTVWVLNDIVTEHCLLEFKWPAHPTKIFTAARHEGTICGWYPPSQEAKFLIEGYTPRRRA